MTKQPEDWLDDVPGDDIEDEDDEIIWVSKSEIKRGIISVRLYLENDIVFFSVEDNGPGITPVHILS